MLPSLFKKLLLARMIKYSDGKLQVMDVPLIMFPVESLARLWKALINSVGVDNAKKIISEISYIYVKNIMSLLKVKYRNITKSFNTLFSFLQESLEVSGYGKTILKKLKVGDIVEIEFRSVLAEKFKELYGKVDYPICWHLLGYIKAVAEEISNGKKITIVEEKCIARGDEICRFIVKWD